MGDFNHCALEKTLKCFYKYVSCPTRKGKTLDQCYGPIKGAYDSIPLPLLGSADHNAVHLIPAYRTCLQREKTTTRTIKVWTEEAKLSLQGCLDCTVWDEFIQTSQDINELADVVSSWVTYCEDIVIPTKVVKVYPNNKPWVSKQLKTLLNKKKQAFKNNSITELHTIQKDIKREIRRAKLEYKHKVELKLSNNSLGSAWDSVKKMVGLSDKTKKKLALNGYPTDSVLAHELNTFNTRFDTKYNFKNEHLDLKHELLTSTQPTVCFSLPSVVKICKVKTSPGPDNISGKLLSCCAEQLGPIFKHIFNLSLKLTDSP